MRYLISTLLLLCLSADALSDCGEISLTRARFAMAVADREPVGEELIMVPSSHEVLFFFVEVLHGGGQTLRHQWFYNDELMADIKLQIGGERWRTWSRKTLGLARSGSWRVEVRDQNNCLLTSKTLGADGKLPVLEQARSLLREGDLVGAKLLVKTEMANNIPYRQRLERFLDQDLVIAQLKQQLEQNQLYTAEARLSQLQTQSLSAEQTQQLVTLREQLEQQREALVAATNIALRSLEKVLGNTLNGGQCPNSDDAINQQLALMPQGKEMLISAWSLADQTLDISLIDQRTGYLHALSLNCPTWQTGATD